MVNVNGKMMTKEQFKEWVQINRLTIEHEKKIAERKKKRVRKK